MNTVEILLASILLFQICQWVVLICIWAKL